MDIGTLLPLFASMQNGKGLDPSMLKNFMSPGAAAPAAQAAVTDPPSSQPTIPPNLASLMPFLSQGGSGMNNLMPLLFSQLMNQQNMQKNTPVSVVKTEPQNKDGQSIDDYARL